MPAGDSAAVNINGIKTLFAHFSLMINQFSVLVRDVCKRKLPDCTSVDLRFLANFISANELFAKYLGSFEIFRSD